MVKDANETISIAIETSSRYGGIALGRNDSLIATADFDANRRQAVQLVSRLAELLEENGLQPDDVDEVYISIGPGSFTGLRIGITVAKTLLQAVEFIRPEPKLRCVTVPSTEVVAENFSSGRLKTEYLGVVMDAGKQELYSAIYRKAASGELIASFPARVLKETDFLTEIPKPITLTGEALAYHQKISAQGITIAPKELWYPTAQCLWKVARRMALKGNFCQYNMIRPIYIRKTSALFHKRSGQ
ncbi:MAG: tRNA (adenosine(37)-N6)-threonylcarbamoyltransferase complex dimerization subunit type 1 TsaB [Planctomycetes bacterium]|nr:tRNA (adenosine(37)-N6)-threonylcarbamoyltransferase complex dimerization subunit type 1 TsaB [Planctomycetota bacterium]